MKKSGNLLEMSKGRNNNLNIIRFIAALLVIFSHAVPICKGSAYTDCLSVWMNGRLSFGSFAVAIFFVIGGFLIAKSAEGKKRASAFWKARCRRIFPQLIFVTLILALVAGPVLSELPLEEYYTSTVTWKYLLNSIFILQHNLPGVFENNIYGAVVNGPLWTLPVEFMCYIMCFAALKIGVLSKKYFRFTAIPAVVVAVFFSVLGNTFLLAIVRPVILFYMGMGFYVYRKKIVLDIKWGGMSVILFLACVWLKADFPAMYIFFPYMIFWLAFGTKHKLSGFGKRAECSYGMYLWGWPVAQTICMLFGGGMDWRLNAFLTAILSIGLGIFNYYAVDKTIEWALKVR